MIRDMSNAYTMRIPSHCIRWSVGVIIVVGIVVLARHVVKGNREGFQAVENCLNQGYPHDFCMHTPLDSIQGGDYCNCANGQLGIRPQPGLCSCFPYKNMFPFYPSPAFSDWLR